MPRENTFTIKQIAFRFNGRKVIGIDASGDRVDREKPPVLFLHGITSSSSRDELYQPFFRQLVAQGYRVIAFDMRGHGDNPHEFNAKEMTQDVLRALRQLKRNGVHHVILAGHSLGAVVAVDALASNTRNDIPEISALALFAPPNDLKTNPLAVVAHTALTNLPENARLQTSGACALQKIYPLLDPANRGLQHVTRLLHPTLTQDGGIQARFLRVTNPRSFAEELIKFPVFTEAIAKLADAKRLPPTRVILGSKDWIAGTINPRERRTIQKALMEKGVLVNILPIGHIPRGKDLDKVVNQLLEDVNRQES